MTKMSHGAYHFLVLSLLSLVVWQGHASQMRDETIERYTRVRRGANQVVTATDACSDRQRTLSRRVVMTVQDAGMENFSSKKILAYEQAFLKAYNNLRTQVCRGNPYLTVAAVKFMDDSTSPTTDLIGRELKLVFEVTARCKWCNSNTTLFQNPASARRLTAVEEWDRNVAPDQDSLDTVAEFHTDPALTNATGTINSRRLSKGSRGCRRCLSLTPERFTLRFNTVLKSFEKKNAKRSSPPTRVTTRPPPDVVSRLLPASTWSELYQVPCSNVVNQLETSFIIPFTADSSKPITSEGLDALAQGVLETINSFYILRDGACDPLFRVALSANAELLSTNILNRRSLATTTLKVSVIYTCKGCSSGSTLTNDAARMRRHLESDSHRVDARRSLGIAIGTGECYCLVGATDFEAPTRSEFSSAYSETVALLISRGTIDFVTSVGDVSEVVEFDCSPPEDARQTGLVLRACRGSNALLTDDLGVLADSTMTALNELVERSCDQGSLLITGVRFLETLTTNGGGCTGTRYLYAVDFNCRDCSSDSKLLSNSPSNRALEAWVPETRDIGVGRHLSTCFCDVNNPNPGRRLAEVVRTFEVSCSCVLSDNVETAHELISVQNYSPLQVLSALNATLVKVGLTLYELSESAINTMPMTSVPSGSPSKSSERPSKVPSGGPSQSSEKPSKVPSGSPSQLSEKPSKAPTGAPSQSSEKPSQAPSAAPSETCGEMTETSFLIEFTGVPDGASSNGLATLSEGVVDTLNSLFLSNKTICDPFFRVVTSASAKVVTIDDVPESIDGRRSLVTVKRITIKVSIIFRCKSCKSGATLLKNDAVSRRRLESEFAVVPVRRSLIPLATSTDYCTCPEGEPDFEVPTRSEFGVAFKKTVSDLKASRGELDFVISVGKTTEVVEFNCTSPTENRTTYMTLRACYGDGSLVDLTVHQSSIESAIKESLTDLLAKFCNRESRTITAVSFLAALVESDCSLTEYFFSVDFTCQGCPSNMKLLSNITSSRALAGWISELGYGTDRRLSSSGDTCFCDVNSVDELGPRESEVSRNAVSI